MKPETLRRFPHLRALASAVDACEDYTDRRNYTPGSLALYRAVVALYTLAVRGKV